MIKINDNLWIRPNDILQVEIQNPICPIGFSEGTGSFFNSVEKGEYRKGVNIDDLDITVRSSKPYKIMIRYDNHDDTVKEALLYFSTKTERQKALNRIVKQVDQYNFGKTHKKAKKVSDTDGRFITTKYGESDDLENIDTLGLSVNTSNGLKRNKIFHISQLTQLSETVLLNSRGIGIRKVAEIKEKLALKGLTLKEGDNYEGT